MMPILMTVVYVLVGIVAFFVLFLVSFFFLGRWVHNRRLSGNLPEIIQGTPAPDSVIKLAMIEKNMPNYSDAWKLIYEEGLSYYKKKKYPEALLFISRSLEKAQANAKPASLGEIFFNRGNTYDELGNVQNGGDPHDDIVKGGSFVVQSDALTRKELVDMPMLGQSRVIAGKYYALAVEDYSKAIDLGFDCWEVYMNRGRCLFKLSKFNEATQDNQEAYRRGAPQ
jgi:tetratricopeptide (TPR) repeat protein